MWCGIAWLILIVAVFCVAYFRFPTRMWIPFSAVVLFITSIGISVVPAILFWLIWFALTLLMVADSLRWRWVIKPFLHWFRQQQPPISASERDVLEAGGVWMEKEFFSGCPDWQRIFTHQKRKLTDIEQSFLDNQVTTLCSMLSDWEIQQANNFPDSAWEYIKREKFWGMIIDKKYGGLGFSAIAHSAVVTKIASRSISGAVTVMVPNSLGPAEFISYFGSEEQKHYYLPRLAMGEEIGAFALTGPSVGSDAMSVPDTGVVCRGNYDGKEVLGIRLNFNKRYITLAPVATLFAIAFKLQDPEHLLGENAVGITVALVPRNTHGVEAGSRHQPLNQGFLNGPVRGKEVFIPVDFVVGGVKSCGKGWRMMMECLSVGRGISLPALATGAAQLSCRTSGAYAQLRRQFHRSIGQFEGVEIALAKIAGFTYLCDSTREFTAAAVDAGVHPSIASAITKYHLTELGRQSVMHAMDIHAGRGIQMGPRNYLACIYEGIPIAITVEGANILTRNLIIYGQGVLRCHPYLRDELIAAENPSDANRNKPFDRLFLSHIGFLLNIVARTFIYGISGGRGIRIKQNTRTKKYLRQLTRMTYAFNVLTELTLAVVGAKFKFKEALSARLGDVMSHLYLASAVLHRYSANQEPLDEWPLVQWSLDYCLWKIQDAFDEILMNFPNCWLAGILRWLVFPWGRSYRSPNDQLSFSVAQLMQKSGNVRDKITQYCYIGDSQEDSVGRVEMAFKQWEKVKSLWGKMHADSGAIMQDLKSAYENGKINENEYKELCKFAELYWDALQVDEFMSHERKPNDEKERL